TPITQFIQDVESVVDSLEMKEIVETTGEDVYFATMAPDLTDTQRTNLLNALKDGYFEQPRETSLQELAEGAGVSRAAYTESLRAAEKKLLYSFFHPSYEG
ncbi:MAG: helix-turn-helix domain-containing protein, partial [Halobacteriaceae archaeon]